MADGSVRPPGLFGASVGRLSLEAATSTAADLLVVGLGLARWSDGLGLDGKVRFWTVVEIQVFEARKFS